MGDKPSHKIVPLGGPDCEPAEIHYCEDCKVHFASEPCTGENTVKVDGSLVSCCPMDPAHGEEDREYWTVNEDYTHQTQYLAQKPGPLDFSECQKEKVERFHHKDERCDHSNDCCGCWFQSSEVRMTEKDGWTIWSKSHSKNV